MLKQFILLTIFITYGFPAFSKDADVINKAVKYCVDFVHNSSGTDLEKYSFSKFDAYYNPATGRVANNVIYADDQLSLFKFNKCMVTQGVPLADK